jgi:hypothetical protein
MALKDLGFIFSEPDSIFGPATYGAVLTFQRVNGLQVDGKVGPKTWAAILSSIRSMVVVNSVIPLLPGIISAKLFEYYTVKANYDSVFNDVLSWYPNGTHNGCCAFMSTALRHIGVDVPKTADPIFGLDISLVTGSLSWWMKNKAGWKLITNNDLLAPGDIIFTQPSTEDSEHPAHVYMFAGWSSKATGLGNVVDNQRRYMHIRNIGVASGGYSYTPYAYHFRAN